MNLREQLAANVSDYQAGYMARKEELYGLMERHILEQIVVESNKGVMWYSFDAGDFSEIILKHRIYDVVPRELYARLAAHFANEGLTTEVTKELCGYYGDVEPEYLEIRWA